jgi:hypothetical protein
MTTTLAKLLEQKRQNGYRKTLARKSGSKSSNC